MNDRTRRRIARLLTIALLLPLAQPPAGAQESLTLRAALARALDANPALDAATQAVRARAAEARQAARLPNPELKAEVENIGGSGPRNGVETAETTLRLAQLIELGGKRGARQALAGLLRDGAQWDVESARASLAASVAEAFVALLVAQRRVAAAEEFAGLARDTEHTVTGQFAAGAGSPADAARVRLATASAAAQIAARESERDAARVALAALWGTPDAEVGTAVGELDAIGRPPDLAALGAALDRNPDLARWATELAARDAAVAVEQAAAVPNLSLGAGPRYFSDTDDVALVAELWIPLPVFDRNQDAIDAARARREQGDAERRGAERGARAALARAASEWRGAAARAAVIHDALLPAAAAAQAESDRAWRAGATRYLEVIEARRSAFELRDEETAALATAHRARIDVDRLTGGADALMEDLQ